MRQRAFTCLARAVIAATLWVAAAVGAQEPAVPSKSDEAIAVSAALFGLEFTEGERAMMAADLNGRLHAFQALRAYSFPNDLAPPLLFNPRPPGFKISLDQTRPPWQPAAGAQRPALEEDLAFAPITELAALIRNGQLTSEELTRMCLERLKKYGPHLHCVVTLTEDLALTQARRADAELRSGKWRGPLHGIPYVAKDLLDTRDIPTTWGISIHANRIPAADATVIRKLEEAGAVLTAKSSVGELAMGDVWFGGLTRNPWNPGKGSSGSSAGSAAAVAAGLVPFGIGTETLGSIVSPCHVCGATGLRPSFGRVSRAGAMTACWSLDKIGPIARSAEDCALVLDAIRGADPADPCAVDAAFPFTQPKKNLRVGYVKADFERGAKNQSNDLATLDVVRKLGFELRELEWPEIAPQALMLTLEAEFAAAFDELTRSNDDDLLVQQSASSLPAGFRSSRFIPAVEYLQAMRLRTRLIGEMAKLFEQVDVIVAPAWGSRQLLYTNMTGQPCVVIPNGVKTGGQAASICFISSWLGEADAIQLAAACQAVTPFHRQRPPLDVLLKK